MGTVVKFKNVKLVIHSKDHPPAHVHALAPDAEAKISLTTFEVIESKGFTQKALSRIRDKVQENHQRILEVWHEYHE